MNKKLEEKVEVAHQEVPHKDITTVDVLRDEIETLRAELKAMRSDKKVFSAAEQVAIEEAREMMLLDDEKGPCYMRPIDTDPDYIYRPVDTTRIGRVDRLLRKGYEIVEDPNFKLGDQTVSTTTPLGAAVTVQLGGDNTNRPGILMRIKKDVYEKRQQLEAKRRKADHEATLQGMANNADFGSIETSTNVYNK